MGVLHAIAAPIASFHWRETHQRAFDEITYNGSGITTRNLSNTVLRHFSLT